MPKIREVTGYKSETDAKRKAAKWSGIANKLSKSARTEKEHGQAADAHNNARLMHHHSYLEGQLDKKAEKHHSSMENFHHKQARHHIRKSQGKSGQDDSILGNHGHPAGGHIGHGR
jgi:hypothetical protein